MYYPEKSSLQIRQEFVDRLFACLGVLVNLSISSIEGSVIDVVISKVKHVQALLPPLFNNPPLTSSGTLTLSLSPPPPPITREALHTVILSYTPPVPTTEATLQTANNKALNQFTSFLPSSSTQVASVTSLSTFLESLHTHLLEQAPSTDTVTATVELSIYIHLAALLAIYGWSSPSTHSDGDNNKSATTTATRYSTDGDASSKSHVNTNHNATTSSTTLACDICGRSVDLAYFSHSINTLSSTHTSPASIKLFDPAQQHRSYCPYIHSHRIPTTDTGTNTSIKLTGSEMILDELSDKLHAIGGHTSVLGAGKDATTSSSSALIGSSGSGSNGSNSDGVVGEVGERSYARIKAILRHIIV